MYKPNKIGNTITCKGNPNADSVNLMNFQTLDQEGLG
jgi:hypothetical protein